MNESEWKTRKLRIDKRLTGLSSPWTIVHYHDGLNPSQLSHHAVEEYPTDNGPADYALFVDGKLLGLIEAKKVSINPQNVLEQAKRYARGLPDTLGDWGGLRVPFLYSTNGEIFWFLDVRGNKQISRRISSFHTPDALREWFARDTQTGFNWFLETPIEKIERLRPYQQQAIFNTESCIINGQRNMLLAMATGTGKTFMTVAQLYRLLESKVVKRILFLVDRKVLAAQAVRELAAFTTPKGNKFNQEYEVYSQKFRREDFGDDDPFNPSVLPNDYLTDPQSTHTFVYVSTIQRMTINLFGSQHAYAQEASDPDFEEDTDTVDIPIHAFDVVIADECHRGYTASESAIWRQTLEHFDAVRIGLTATPAAHTVGLFGKPVFRYSVDEAIEQGYLVDYDVVSVQSEVKMNGAFLNPGETVGYIDTTTGQEIYDELEDERAYSSTEIEQKITAPDSNRKIIEAIAEYAWKHEQETGLFPKTLIFAVNDLPHTSHADQLVRICREVFDQGDEFVQKITGNPNVDRPLQRIREFRNRPNPRVVVTVDMLSTGVDIPSLEFIVFMRPVKSRILWEQMLGRGTRRCDEINKSKFVVFDCFGGSLVEYFRDVSAFNVDPLQKEAVPLEQVIENIYQNVDREYNVRILVRRLRRIEKDMSGKAREAFAAYIPDGDMGRFAGELPGRIEKDFISTLKLLRNPSFVDLLLNYPRAKRTFVVAYETLDNVSTELLIRTDQGPVKPGDYLKSFATFVQAKEHEIEAIEILLHKPKGWSASRLEELRQSLRSAVFNEQELQKAHEAVYHKSLADIISMVKHAAREEEPILTAEERVDRALERIKSGRTYSAEEEQWLGLIRVHLIQNLTIEMNDFMQLPAFERKGGLSKVRKVFKQQPIEQLIDALNEALAL